MGPSAGQDVSRREKCGATVDNGDRISQSVRLSVCLSVLTLGTEALYSCRLGLIDSSCRAGTDRTGHSALHTHSLGHSALYTHSPGHSAFHCTLTALDTAFHCTLTALDTAHFTLTALDTAHFTLTALGTAHCTLTALDTAHFTLTVLDTAHCTHTALDTAHFTLTAFRNPNQHPTANALVPPPPTLGNTGPYKNKAREEGAEKNCVREELHDLYCSPNIRFRWEGHVACVGENSNTHCSRSFLV